jgi:hypothetical protein
MSPVPEHQPTIPAVYPRPSPVSSMEAYVDLQFVVELARVETI